MKNKKEAETISQDHVYATGRQIKEMRDRFDILEARVNALHNIPASEGESASPDTLTVEEPSPIETYRDKAKRFGVNSFGKSKEAVLAEIAEKENGTKEDEQEAITGDAVSESV